MASCSMKAPDLASATIDDLQNGLQAGHFTSVDLVKAYIARIAEVNSLLKAVISVSPCALRAAAKLDRERAYGNVRSVLHGIPIAVKDNIATRPQYGMDTTAGSFALQGAVVPGNAECIERLVKEGAIILCKTNLSEWANIRGVGTAGWSAVGGQCTSPFYPNGCPSGSSSGSAVAIAAGLAAAALGTDTGGSITYPASRAGLVGFRPTVGQVPMGGVVPVSSHRDVVGPITRTVQDAVHLYQAMICTARNTSSKPDHAAPWSDFKLLLPLNFPDVDNEAYTSHGRREAFDRAVEEMRNRGAVIVEISGSEACIAAIKDYDHDLFALGTDFKVEIAGYLRSLCYIPSGVQSLADLVHRIAADARETPPGYDRMSIFRQALESSGTEDPSYVKGAAKVALARHFIDKMLEEHDADAFVMLSPPAKLWSDAAYPRVTVPLGCTSPSQHGTAVAFDAHDGSTKPLVMHPNIPFGITFASTAHSDKTLLELAQLFEILHKKTRDIPEMYSAAKATSQVDSIGDTDKGASSKSV